MADRECHREWVGKGGRKSSGFIFGCVLKDGFVRETLVERSKSTLANQLAYYAVVIVLWSTMVDAVREESTVVDSLVALPGASAGVGAGGSGGRGGVL